MSKNGLICLHWSIVAILALFFLYLLGAFKTLGFPSPLAS